MARLLLYGLIAVGIAYGAWAVFGGPDKVPELRSDATSGEDADPPASAGNPGAADPAVGPADIEEEVRRRLAGAESACDRGRGAASAADAIALSDEARRLVSRAYLRLELANRESDLAGKLAALNEQVLSAPVEVPGKSFLYTFGATDRLWTLCRESFPKEHGVRLEPGFLLWLNGISDARRIREGQILRVPTEELTLLVSKTRLKLWVLLGGVVLREFRVGLGAQDKTPEGEFEIDTKIEKPDWYHDGRRIAYGHPDNPLGTRWMGFKRTRKAAGYGIHGTDEPESIGKAVSQGCVRMLDAEVEELFTWVPRGTKVSVVR